MATKLVIALLASTLSMAATAQVGTTIKESASAAVETTKQAGDNVKGAMSSEPNKSEEKAEARAHKARAHRHGHKAKAAAKEIGR